MIHSCTIEARVGRHWARLPWRGDTPPALISLKSAGDLSLARAEERAAFIASHGWDRDQTYALKQTHSHTVWLTDELQGEARPRLGHPGDGLITQDPRVTLTVTVADCLPIFLYDPRQGVRGLCHSGWKGTGIANRAVARMSRAFDTRPEDLTVLIGPGIGSCCYDVPADRFERFKIEFGGGATVGREGRLFLDLRQANLNLLEEEGVKDIWVVRDCTRCHPALSSFRGQGREGYIGMMAVLGPQA